MTINALSSPWLQFAQPRNHAAGNASRPSFSLPQDSTPSLSPIARFLARLEKHQEQDPEKFKEVAGDVAARLREAAEKAEAHGNTARAGRLNKLADLMQKSAQEGTVPTLQELQLAGFFAGFPAFVNNPDLHASDR